MKRPPRGLVGVVRRVGIGTLAGAAVFVVWWLRPWELPGWALLILPALILGAWWQARKVLSPDDLRELRRQVLQLRLARMLKMSVYADADPISDKMFDLFDKYPKMSEADALDFQTRIHGLLSDRNFWVRAHHWNRPLAKVLLPKLLGICKAKELIISKPFVYDFESGRYIYHGAYAPFTVKDFEPHRGVIERMWKGPVIIEDSPNFPGSVIIRPRPILPAVIPMSFGLRGSVVFGTDLLTGNVVEISAAEIPHLLIMGTSGFGKSVFLHQLVVQLLRARNDMVAGVTLIDLKGGVEFMRYQQQDARVRAVWQFDQVVKVVQDLVEVMQARQAEMLERGWRSYPGKRLFFVVDEFAQIQLWPVEGKEGRAEHDRLLANLNRLSMLGRSAGIVLVAAVQKGTTDVMDSSFRTNLQGQICFRMPNRLAAASMFGSTDDLLLDPVAMPKGQFIFYDSTVGRTRYLQAHVIQDG